MPTCSTCPPVNARFVRARLARLAAGFIRSERFTSDLSSRSIHGASEIETNEAGETVLAYCGYDYSNQEWINCEVLVVTAFDSLADAYGYWSSLSPAFPNESESAYLIRRKSAVARLFASRAFRFTPRGR